MSLAALAIAVRNTLREDLPQFYNCESDLSLQERDRKANCRVMPSHYPPPNCGQEFIAIYGSAHRPASFPYTAVDEKFGITVAVTRRIGNVPRDYRGEVGYVKDLDVYAMGWKSLEERCREIVGLIDRQYQLLRDADALFLAANGFSEPLQWVGTDPAPQEVGAEHFCAWHGSLDGPAPPLPEGDTTYGLLMHVFFDNAIRFQRQATYDQFYEQF